MIATVVHADGSPVEGAVVVTSMGGQGVSGRDGMVRFAVDLDQSLETAHVTAVAVVDGVNHVGSVQVGSSRHGDHGLDTNAGSIIVHPSHECESAWLPTFGGDAGLTGAVWAFTLFDDGSGCGPALYAGGSFKFTLGGIELNNIAKWDGAEWSALGDGTNGPVHALTVYEGDLIAAGKFTHAGGNPASSIAKWNCSTETWSPLGSGLMHGASSDFLDVYALTVYEGELIAGGWFTHAGGDPARSIAKWNGSTETWSPLGDGIMHGAVLALTVYEGDLIAGGIFIYAGGVETNNIAKWNGSTGTWSSLGSGVGQMGGSAAVHALEVFEGDLIVGGNFTIAGGSPADRIAKWNGTWYPMGNGINTGMDDSVFALTVFDGELIAGGKFTLASLIEVNHIAKWDGTAWLPLGSGINGWVLALTVFEGRLIAGGHFTHAGGVKNSFVAEWGCEVKPEPKCDQEWLPTFGDDAGMNSQIHALTVYNGDLIAGGDFTTAGTVSANRIAKWDGKAWSALGDGVSGGGFAVLALTVFEGDLIAAGTFTHADGNPASRIARWNGSAWFPLGDGLAQHVNALTVFNGELIAGGGFTSPANRIAKWNGSGWSPLGSGMDNAVRVLTVFNGELIAGGWFTSPASRIAKWDGTAWSALGDGTNGAVHALTAFNGELIAGGFFTIAGGDPASRIAKWNGSTETWSPLGSGMNGWVDALTVFDVGNCPALYAGGAFTTAGGVQVNRIAKWDGSTETWSPLDSGMGGPSPRVWALSVFDDASGRGPALYAGGIFTRAGSVEANYIAEWRCEHPCPLGDITCDSEGLLLLLENWGPCCDPCPPSCLGDLTGDCNVGVADLLIVLLGGC